MSLLSYFIKANTLLSISAVVLLLVGAIFKSGSLRVPAFYQLQLGYGLITLSLISPFVYIFQPVASLFSFSALPQSSHLADKIISSTVQYDRASWSLSERQVELLFLMVLASLAIGMILFFIDLLKLRAIRQSVYVLRKLGRVTVAISKVEMIPSSFSLWHSSFVVLPPSVLTDRVILKHCIQHELQHIRQMDTFWIYVVAFLEKTLVLNPVVRVLGNIIKDLQELSCDEELIERKKVIPSSYAATLLAVMEGSSGKGFHLAPSILAKHKTNKLIRRIKTMKNLNNGRVKIKICATMFALSIAAVMTAAHISRKMDITTDSTRFVQYDIEISENGKVISTPQVITNIGDEASILLQENKGKQTYYKVKPEISAKDANYIETTIEYGVTEGSFSADPIHIKFNKIGEGKLVTPSRITKVGEKPTVMWFGDMKITVKNLPNQKTASL